MDFKAICPYCGIDVSLRIQIKEEHTRLSDTSIDIKRVDHCYDDHEAKGCGRDFVTEITVKPNARTYKIE